jgi:hypothetical protein
MEWYGILKARGRVKFPRGRYNSAYLDNSGSHVGNTVSAQVEPVSLEERQVTCSRHVVYSSMVARLGLHCAGTGV